MKRITLLLVFMAVAVFANAQYQFETEMIPCTAVKDQQRTGTCWSFSTTSFLEAEIMRLGGPQLDLSDMYSVYHIYHEKALNYVLRQGKANFSQGALAHDVMRVFEIYGAVPELAYDGRKNPGEAYNHSEFSAGMKGFLDGVIQARRPSPYWQEAFTGIVQAYMNEPPATFVFDGREYTSNSFSEMLPINPDDYVRITSFSHHPFYQPFILEIPDNFSNAAYINLPLDEFMSIVDHALAQGFTISWDGDVGEKGFSQKESLAVLPVDPNREDLFTKPGEEEEVTQQNRQEAFESYRTTDDHLMHVVGTAKDQQGTKYYVIKNSWGPEGPDEGYLNMSEAFFRMKTVAILVHKDAIPEDIMQKMP